MQVRKHIFSLHEEMGFNKDELRQLVLESPVLLLRDDEKVEDILLPLSSCLLPPASFLLSPSSCLLPHDIGS